MTDQPESNELCVQKMIGWIRPVCDFPPDHPNHKDRRVFQYHAYMPPSHSQNDPPPMTPAPQPEQEHRIPVSDTPQIINFDTLGSAMEDDMESPTPAEERVASTNHPGDSLSADAQMHRALNSLYLAVPEDVARDVEQKVMARYIELKTEIAELRKQSPAQQPPASEGHDPDCVRHFHDECLMPSGVCGNLRDDGQRCRQSEGEHRVQALGHYFTTVIIRPRPAEPREDANDAAPVADAASRSISRILSQLGVWKIHVFNQHHARALAAIIREEIARDKGGDAPLTRTTVKRANADTASTRPQECDGGGLDIRPETLARKAAERINRALLAGQWSAVALAHCADVIAFEYAPLYEELERLWAEADNFQGVLDEERRLASEQIGYLRRQLAERDAQLAASEDSRASAHEAVRIVGADLDNTTAELADLRQTSGDLCEVCNWRGKRGGVCAFCEVRRLESDVQRLHGHYADLEAKANRQYEAAEQMRREKDAEIAAERAKFEQHAAHVGAFLSEMHATMIDPLAEGTIPVSKMCRLLITAAKEQREREHRKDAEIAALKSGLANGRRIDGKFHIANGEIIKTSSGEIVPHDEPLILMRGRDRLALPTLQHYYKLCELDGCTEYQLGMVMERVAEFGAYAGDPAKMKQPGITRGAVWNPDQNAAPSVERRAGTSEGECPICPACEHATPHERIDELVGARKARCCERCFCRREFRDRAIARIAEAERVSAEEIKRLKAGLEIANQHNAEECLAALLKHAQPRPADPQLRERVAEELRDWLTSMHGWQTAMQWDEADRILALILGNAPKAQEVK